MKKTGIFYGSSTGTCEDLANQIADKMGVAASDVYSADKLSADLVKEYDLLILGTSTWGDGELQDDWYDGIKVLKSADLSFKSIALFGCGLRILLRHLLRRNGYPVRRFKRQRVQLHRK